MGAVYRAVDTRLERRIALKLLRPDGDPDARARGATRLLHEARAAAALEHVNAVAVHDVGEVESTPYIAMELVVGRSLRSYVGDATVPIANRVRWLVDVAHALDAAHARGLVHRDVKPENVMIREDGTVKVLDFGIAWMPGRAAIEVTRAASRSDVIEAWRSTFTREGSLVGTPRYMSPEQIQGAPIDGRTDQFSWGVMAYELLTGKPPWLGDTSSLTTLFDIVDAEPVPLRRLAPAVSPAVDAVVQRTMRKGPEDRFPSMRAVVAALDAAGARPPRGARWVALGAAGAGLLAVVAAAATALRSKPSVAGTASSTPPLLGDNPPVIVLLLDAARGITLLDGKVTAWTDQASNGNDATVDAPKHAPTLLTNAIHGLPAVHFEGGSYMTIADSPTLRFGHGDFTVEVVARHDRPMSTSVLDGYNITTGYGMLYGKSEEPDPFRGVALFVNYPQPVPSTKLGVQTSYPHYVLSTSQGLNDGRAHLFGVRRAGTVLEVRVDGVAQAHITGADDDVSAPGQPAFIGGHLEDEMVIQQLKGDIAEIAVVAGAISAHNLDALESDLKTKFGL